MEVLQGIHARSTTETSCPLDEPCRWYHAEAAPTGGATSTANRQIHPIRGQTLSFRRSLFFSWKPRLTFWLFCAYFTTSTEFPFRRFSSSQIPVFRPEFVFGRRWNRPAVKTEWSNSNLRLYRKRNRCSSRDMPLAGLTDPVDPWQQIQLKQEIEVRIFEPAFCLI